MGSSLTQKAKSPFIWPEAGKWEPGKGSLLSGGRGAEHGAGAASVAPGWMDVASWRAVARWLTASQSTHAWMLRMKTSLTNACEGWWLAACRLPSQNTPLWVINCFKRKRTNGAFCCESVNGELLEKKSSPPVQIGMWKKCVGRWWQKWSKTVVSWSPCQVCLTLW